VEGSNDESVLVTSGKTLNGSAYTAPVVGESDAHTFDVQSGASLDPAPQKVGQTTTQE